jgi:hypothetical protein
MNYHLQKVRGAQGDCMRTCIACILDLEIDNVPNFASHGLDALDPDERAIDAELFVIKIEDWLDRIGLSLVRRVSRSEPLI